MLKENDEVILEDPYFSWARMFRFKDELDDDENMEELDIDVESAQKSPYRDRDLI